MNETVKYRYRITILRSSGSVWVEDYSDMDEMISASSELISEYPHLVMSKQKIVVKDDEEDE